MKETFKAIHLELSDILDYVREVENPDNQHKQTFIIESLNCLSDLSDFIFDLESAPVRTQPQESYKIPESLALIEEIVGLCDKLEEKDKKFFHYLKNSMQILKGKLESTRSDTPECSQ